MQREIELLTFMVEQRYQRAAALREAIMSASARRSETQTVPAISATLEADERVSVQARDKRLDLEGEIERVMHHMRETEPGRPELPDRQP